MPEIQQSKSNNKKVSARVILSSAVALFVFLLLFSSAINLMKKYFSMRSHIKALREDQAALKEKKAATSEMNEYIKSPEGREEIFREKYRLVKPGEGLIVITEPVEKKAFDGSRHTSFFGNLWNILLRGLGIR